MKIHKGRRKHIVKKTCSQIQTWKSSQNSPKKQKKITSNYLNYCTLIQDVWQQYCTAIQDIWYWYCTVIQNVWYRYCTIIQDVWYWYCTIIQEIWYRYCTAIQDIWYWYRKKSPSFYESMMSFQNVKYPKLKQPTKEHCESTIFHGVSIFVVFVGRPNHEICLSTKRRFSLMCIL